MPRTIDPSREARLRHPTLHGTTYSRRSRRYKMIRFTYMLGGTLAAAAIWLIYRGQQPRPVEVLAHRLEEAWADHHTRV